MTQDSAGRQAQPEDGAQAASGAARPDQAGQPASEQPLPEQPLAAAPPPPPPPPAPGQGPAKKRRTGLIVTLIAVAGVLLVCVVGGVAVLLLGGGGDIPQAGECMSDAVDPNEMEVVACDSPDAAWSVIGSGGSMTRGEFNARSQQQQVCEEHPGTLQALWLTDAVFSSSDDTEGEVVCLGPIGGGEESETTG